MMWCDVIWYDMRWDEVMLCYAMQGYARQVCKHASMQNRTPVFDLSLLLFVFKHIFSWCHLMVPAGIIQKLPRFHSQNGLEGTSPPHFIKLETSVFPPMVWCSQQTQSISYPYPHPHPSNSPHIPTFDGSYFWIIMHLTNMIAGD